MPNKGDEVLRDMPRLLKELEDSDLLYQQRGPRNFWLSSDKAGRNRPEIPQKGIYVFYENERPAYVGRSNRRRLQKRIGEHSLPKGPRGTSSWAFKRAKEAAGSNPAFAEIFKSTTGKDRQLEADPDFATMFASERKKIGQMRVRVVGIPDGPTMVAGRNGLEAARKQYFFEAYVAAARDIPFEWNTH